jgi:hypothetical protein
MSGLTTITVLNLHTNSFRGTLPASFSTLENLRKLSVSSNFLSGEIALHCVCAFVVM